MSRIPLAFPIVNLWNVDPWGRCDISGLPTMHADLVKQMDYFGETLQWTGYMVRREFYDEPNPQKIPVRLKPDPVPVRNPRIFHYPKGPPAPTNLRVTAIAAYSLTFAWDPVQQATNYAVQWSLVGGVPLSTLPLLDPSDMTDSFYTITDLIPQTSYIVSVSSLNNVGFAILPRGKIANSLSWNQSAQGGPDTVEGVTSLYVQTS